MEPNLEKNIRETFNELNDIVFAFTDEQLNKIPQVSDTLGVQHPGSWTGGQTVEHILKSLNGIPQLMSQAADTPGRNPGEKIKELEDLFLDYAVKYEAPEFLKPDAMDHKKDDLLNELKEKERELHEAIKKDLSLLCMSFEFPGIGYMTRLEWVHFFLVHTQRHTQQLKNIFNSLKQTL